MAQGALPGFRDFYPPELAERAHLMRVWREVARRYGFVEYDGPPLEPLELYTRKSGDEIVAQLYTFRDKGGREVALRPEMTPTFARMVAARANALRKPVRWFSIPQLFRYERQQRGRLREHFQLNVDIVGEADVLADAELLAAAIDVMRGLGLTSHDVRARVSDRRLLTSLVSSLGVDAAQHGAVFAAVDKIEREPRETITARLVAAGVAPASVDALYRLVRESDWAAVRQAFGARPEVAEHVARLDRYLHALDALGVGDWVQVDLSIVRGLAYYTGIVFELFDARGELRAICGGGRYDSLLGALGGVDLPALGFGMGDVVLGELLRERGLMPSVPATLDYWVAAAEGVPIAEVLGAAHLLRDRGQSVEYVLNAEKLASQKTGAQLKAAQKAGAHRALVLRDAEHAEVRCLLGHAPPREVRLAELRQPPGGAPVGADTTFDPWPCAADQP
ncbi:MAG TPA: histidine--tRNA ligase [Gemmatimonadaceae bacterium]|nr:histidine--tRNA ligase [Gemmatimonadaceae bacterium]